MVHNELFTVDINRDSIKEEGQGKRRIKAQRYESGQLLLVAHSESLQQPSPFNNLHITIIYT